MTGWSKQSWATCPKGKKNRQGLPFDREIFVATRTTNLWLKMVGPISRQDVNAAPRQGNFKVFGDRQRTRCYAKLVPHFERSGITIGPRQQGVTNGGERLNSHDSTFIFDVLGSWFGRASDGQREPDQCDLRAI